MNLKAFFAFLSFFLFFPQISPHFWQQKPKKLVMINPDGDVKKVGRKLVEMYERGVTLQFAEQLQKALQAKYNCSVVLTRSTGEVVLPLQNASFSNRSSADFYLSLHVYRQEEPKPKLHLYHLVFNPMVDLAQNGINLLAFIPLYQAHFKNIKQTLSYAKNIKNVLNDDVYKNKLDFYGPFGIPFKPLVGILAPAVAIEVGICQDNYWKHLVDPIVEALKYLDEA
jgi:N-acetylmuramoyl-L-alanine amidase